MAHAVFVRSPHAHARLGAIETGAAEHAPGVIAVLTAAEGARDGLGPLRPSYDFNVKTGEPLAFLPQPLLATGKVRYAGEAVALVVAETSEQAVAASELIEVDYQPLPAVASPTDALDPAAPLVADEVPANTSLDWRTGDHSAVQQAIGTADHVVTLDLDNHRIITNPMEPRGAIGTYDPTNGRYTLHVSSQNIHGVRDQIARALGVPATAVRLLAPDVGGNFGAKNFVYAEYVLMAWAARLTGRPVRWIATRSEVFLTDHQARDQQARASLALDAEGRFLALEVDSVANAGAYMMSTGGVQTFQYIHLTGSVYRIPAIALSIRAVLTNTTPVGVTRGPGFAEAINIMERLIDRAARQTGIDRIRLRRLNMASADTMPFINAFGEQVDSGTFPETFARALAQADVDGFAARREASRARGLMRGLGFAYHIKGTGGSPHENARIVFEDDGTVTAIAGTHSLGQGHATTFPQIVADRLGLDYDAVRYLQGDTDLVPIGGGSGSSRSTYMGGTALWRACDLAIDKGRPIAAAMLGVAKDQVRFEAGAYSASDTNRSIGLLDVAARARAANEPLDTYYSWTRDWMTFPNGTHVVEVEVDPETGKVTLASYTAVDDYGVLVNPMIVAGQVHGAIVQGIGQALMEEARFDPASAHPATGSFMDYALPRADDLPPIALAFNNSRCTTNPLGVKGCGEAGAIAAFPAINNAIHDALSPLGEIDLAGAATPERVWLAIQSARTP